jgi:hypothetical protein
MTTSDDFPFDDGGVPVEFPTADLPLGSRAVWRVTRRPVEARSP